LDATAIEWGLCPTQGSPPPVPCGVQQADGRLRACVAGERCVCSGDVAPGSGARLSGACALEEVSSGAIAPTDVRCASGFHYVHDGSCVVPKESRVTVVLPSGTFVCPVEVPAEIACGTSIDTECGGGTCLCTGEAPACVVEAAGCASQLAFAGSGRCVAEQDGRVLRQQGPCQSPGTEAGADEEAAQ
jgi:hypothetical protein